MPVAAYVPSESLRCDGIIGGIQLKGDGRSSLGGRNVTLAQISDALTREDSGVKRPILDKTGLAGKYDFSIEFMPTEPPQYSTYSAEQNGGPPFEEALRNQLGLKLEPSTGSVDVLVIDHIEEPSQN